MRSLYGGPEGVRRPNPTGIQAQLAAHRNLPLLGLTLNTRNRVEWSRWPESGPSNRDTTPSGKRVHEQKRTTTMGWTKRTGGILGAAAVAGLLTFANIAAANSTSSLETSLSAGTTANQIAIPPTLGSRPGSSAPSTAAAVVRSCHTFDATVATIQQVNPTAVYQVLDGVGGVGETTVGAPGPQAQKRIQQAVTHLQDLKAQAIARGDSCLGVIEP